MFGKLILINKYGYLISKFAITNQQNLFLHWEAFLNQHNKTFQMGIEMKISFFFF